MQQFKIKSNNDFYNKKDLSAAAFFSKKDNSGFTLVELIIYIAIIGLVIGAFVSFSLSIADSQNKTYVIQEVQANARIAIGLMSQKIKQANGVNIGVSTFDSDPGTLSLSMAAGANNPTIFFLDQDDGILQVTEGVGSPVDVTTNKVKVTNLVFTDLSSTRSPRETIRIEMTIEYDGAEGDVSFSYSQDFQTTVTVRN